MRNFYSVMDWDKIGELLRHADITVLDESGRLKLKGEVAFAWVYFFIQNICPKSHLGAQDELDNNFWCFEKIIQFFKCKV